MDIINFIILPSNAMGIGILFTCFYIWYYINVALPKLVASEPNEHKRKTYQDYQRKAEKIPFLKGRIGLFLLILLGLIWLATKLFFVPKA